MKTILKDYPQNMIEDIDPQLSNSNYISTGDIEFVLSLAENEFVKPFALAFYKYGYSVKKIAKAYGIRKKYVRYVLSEKLTECIHTNIDIALMGVKQYYTNIGRDSSATEMERIKRDHKVEMTTLRADYENKLKRLQEKLNVKTSHIKTTDLDVIIDQKLGADNILSSRDLTMLSKAGVKTYGDIIKDGDKLTEIKYVNKNTIIKLLLRFIYHIFSYILRDSRKESKRGCSNSCEGSFMEN